MTLLLQRSLYIQCIIFTVDHSQTTEIHRVFFGERMLKDDENTPDEFIHA